MKAILILLAICLILILTIIIIVLCVVKRIKRKAKNLINTVSNIIPNTTPADFTLNNLAKVTSDFANEPQQPKSIGGATTSLLPKIERDFPDFHNPDAEMAIKTFITEYINIKYGNQKRFEKSKIDQNIDYGIQKITSNTISNIKLNRISIYDYKKTNDYATITYRASVGFDKNNTRVETVYELDYTLQLKENEIHSKAMTCSNCGAPLSSIDTQCKYCGVKIIKDTIMNWIVMRVVER